MNTPQINIVVPLFNESDVVQELVKRLDSLIERSSLSIEIILIDDGSSDNTGDFIKSQSLRNENYTSVTLSRNFGHQLALTAGLSYVNASEAIMIIDGDLQDPPELLDDFYKKFTEGYDVVYAVRKDRKESFLLKLAYKVFYRLMKKISYVDLPLDSGDFSLISRRVVNTINSMPEQSRFLRGMRGWIGFKQIGIPYSRDERKFGTSKYSFRKLLKLSFDGLFNFSEIPMKIIGRIGFFSIIISTLYLVYTLFIRVFYGNIPDGFTALLSVIVLFGGVQLLAMGLMGEYLLRVFFQVKNRPLFIVDNVVRNKEVVKV